MNKVVLSISLFILSIAIYSCVDDTPEFPIPGSAENFIPEFLDEINFQSNSSGEELFDYMNGRHNGNTILNYTIFPSGSSVIDSSSFMELENVSAVLKAYPDLIISLEGHTDSQGGNEPNLVLSQKRAKACFEKLVSLGIDSSRMMRAGYGEERPRADNNSDEGRILNRRVELIALN